MKSLAAEQSKLRKNSKAFKAKGEQIDAAQKTYATQLIRTYPTFDKYLESQKGRVHKDSLGREVEWGGRQHEVRAAQFVYDSAKRLTGVK